MGKKKKRAHAQDAKREASEQGAQALAQPDPPSTPDARAAATAPMPLGTPRRRMLENAFIALFLAFMLGMPLRYYMGDRGFDERFSWRMFSTIRMLDCKATVVETVEGGDERPVNLGKEVQVAWVGLLERGRELVIEKLLTRRCALPDVRQVRYRLRCESPDGSTIPELTRERTCGGQEGAP